MYAAVRTHANTLCAATAAAAVAVSLVAVPTQGFSAAASRVEQQVIQFDVALTSAASAVASIADSLASPIEPTAAVKAAVTADPVAGGILNAIRTVALLATAVTLPLWWIAFPITFPLGFFIGNAILGPSTSPDEITGIFRGLQLIGAVVFGPVAILGKLLPVYDPATAASAAASRRIPRAASATLAGAEAAEPSVQQTDNALRRSNVNPAAAAHPKRAAKSAAKDDKSKAASAASKRRAAG